jgi:6-phosphogluconolactonase
MNIKFFDSMDHILEELSTRLYQLVNQSKSNTINIALSGGSTPVAFYTYLAQSHVKIDWSRVHLFWGDERCVPPADVQSNFGQANRALISKIDIPAQNIHRIKGENDPVSEASRYQEEIEKFVPVDTDGTPVFDWILLGMGEDGHTASIFPGTPAAKDYRSVCLTAEHPETGQKRVSLGFKVLFKAKQVSFLVTGSSKSDLITKIYHKDAKAIDLPAAQVNLKGHAVEWLIDAEVRVPVSSV